MISAWDVGGEIGRLGRVAHPWSSRERLFAMLELTAYCDESETEHQVSSIAGYWAPAREWERLEAPWKAQLDRFGLTEFHAADCEQGHGEFANRGDRPEIFSAFIDLTNRVDIHGVFAVVDLRGWDKIADRVKELRAKHGMGDAFYVAFQQLMETIAIGVRAFPPEEQVALVFDNRPAFGRVEELFGSLQGAANPALAFVKDRLGTVTKGCSEKLVGLQAADLFAYEVREYFTGVMYGIDPKSVRPQWPRLQGRPISGQHFPQGTIPRLLKVMDRQWRQETKRLAAEKAKAKAARAARGAAYARAHRELSAPRSPKPGPPGEPS